MQKHRIYTNVGRDQKINVEILSDYDIMEILSLKFTQKDIFASGNCSEYGVVVGRISANNGYGVPNARVSIFVPEEDLDENDPVIHSLYPYKDIGDKNDENYRYNLLPSRQQHPGHSPTGTFFDQKDILTREEVLEVFEKYYSFTVKTNNAGDFMIWGVPIGSQILHVDIDLSDIGCFSLRPNDFLNKGYGIEQFESYYKFKSSADIDSLPQIVSFDKTVEIYPFWGNEELCEIGITRTDFDLSERDIKIEPVSIILFSSITDESSHAVKRNGRIRRNSGYKCNLQTSEGHIECVRYTGKSVIGSDGVTKYPELEYFNPTETINEDGVAMVALPMNVDYVYTNELGEQEITNDENKGIPTGAVVRFRFSLDFQSNKVTTAKYLVPNIREFAHNNSGTALGFSDGSEYQESMLVTYQFSDVFEDYLTITPPITGVTIFHTNYDDTVKEHKKNLMLSGATAPQDYFYRFIYGKVYAVSSFHGTHYETRARDAYLGIKEIRPNVESDCASSANYFPTNFAFKNRIKFNVIISQVLLFLQYLFSIVTIKFAEILGKTAYSIGRAMQGIKIIYRIGQRVEDFAYRTQDRYTKELSLTIYPDCEECTGDSEALTNEGITFENSCRRAEVAMTIQRYDNPAIPIIEFLNYYSQETYYFSNSEAPGSTLLPNLFPGESAAQGDGGCDGVQVVNYSMLDWLSDQTLDDGTPRYGVEAFCSGSTLSFDSFADYLQPSTDENRSLFFVEDIMYGFPGMRMGINFNFWYELTNINLNVREEHDWFFAEIAPYIKIVFRIYDRSVSPDEVTSTSGSTMSIEAGCEKYDKLYDESISLRYLWCTAATPTYNSIVPVNPDRQELGGIYIEEPGYGEFTEAGRVATHPYLISTIAGESNTQRMPYKKEFLGSRALWGVGWRVRGIGIMTYDRKTKSGLTEFRDGLFTIIPVIVGTSRNLKVLREWYRRKRVGLSFCGGVVNYSFIDNWLHGVLYFFKFDKRIRWDTEATYDLNQRGSKYPRELVFYNIFDKNFYYRSTPYVFEDGVGLFSGQTYDGKKEILHPTTFFDLGIRDEFLGEICTDVRTDPACSVVRDITVTSYQDPANVVEYAINYRLDTTKSKFDVDDFFSKRHLGSNIHVFDGDITQLMSINCEAGIEAFDLDSPHYYMFNGEYMDPEDNRFGTYFKIGTLYGPTPIDLKLDFNGVYMRLCLNYRLGDNSQVVPFYLWEKEGPGFGQYGDHSDDQTWDKTQIASMPLQRIFSISGRTETKTNYLMADGEEEYILKPMTINHETFSLTGDTEDMLERFEVIDYLAPDPNNVEQYVEGDLWLQALSWGSAGPYKDPWIGYIYVVVNKTWVIQPELYVSDTSGESQENIRETFVPQTAINYWGEINNAKQVLSTPFLFYFGLKPGKTALDLLIKYYGPKDAFMPEEEEICAVSEVTSTPTPITPTPITPTPITPTPITPTPTPPPQVYYYRLNKCIENNSNYYATSLTGVFLSTGTGVWGGINCDPNYAYVVIDHQLNESVYISAGYQNIGMVSASQFQPCYDCNGDPITPPPPPPAYVIITLVRNEANSDPAGSMCGYNPSYGNRFVQGYVLEEYIIPRTAGYTVYPDNTFITPITTTGRWGILYDSNREIAWTITIGSTGPGQISDWTECLSPYPANTIIGQTITNNDPEWDGYYINNSYQQSLFFTNNAITSRNTSMYMLKAGDDYQTSTNNNLDGAVITGNKLTWIGEQTGSIITHGLFAGYNINQIIKWNSLTDVPYGIIFKSGAYGNPNMNITAGAASYNTVKGGRFAGRCKGINGARFYNNTFYGDAGSWYLLLINENSDGEPTYPGNPSINTKVKNNIFYTTTKTPSISIDTGSLSGFECDYNIYWCEAGDHTPVFAIDGSTRTWAQWRALGYDAHSVVVNPNFVDTVEFVPTSKATIQIGTDLGTEFNTGLSTTAEWVVGVTPATRIQSGTWQVGARIFA